MSIQNILKNNGSKLEGKIDNSEFYDFEIVNYSFDAILDKSDFYDYKLGNGLLDFIYIEDFIEDEIGNFIITDDEYILITDDNYMIEYY